MPRRAKAPIMWLSPQKSPSAGRFSFLHPDRCYLWDANLSRQFSSLKICPVKNLAPIHILETDEKRQGRQIGTAILSDFAA